MNPEESGFFVATATDALVVESVDTQDLKSCDHCGRAGSSPARGTNQSEELSKSEVLNSDFFLCLFGVYSLSVSRSLYSLLMKFIPNQNQNH